MAEKSRLQAYRSRSIPSEVGRKKGMNEREGISSLNSATMGLELCVSQGNISLKLLLLQLHERKQDRTRHA